MGEKISSFIGLNPITTKVVMEGDTLGETMAMVAVVATVVDSMAMIPAITDVQEKGDMMTVLFWGREGRTKE